MPFKCDRLPEVLRQRRLRMTVSSVRTRETSRGPRTAPRSHSHNEPSLVVIRQYPGKVRRLTCTQIDAGVPNSICVLRDWSDLGELTFRVGAFQIGFG